MWRHISAAVIPAALLLSASAALAADTNVLTGKAAFGSWDANKVGTRRLIRPSDLPQPYATRSAANAPAQIARPKGALPQVPAGFKVSVFANGMNQPRVIAVAPNGDVFVADSAAGEIDVFRQGPDGKVASHGVFARGLDQPYGIAFYPAKAPLFVYVANTGSVVRFPYRAGDMKAAGPAQTIVPVLPTGGHWTRDIAFSPDGKTLFVSVGSASNVAERTLGGPPPPVFVATHALGATWAREANRADVLAFDASGKNARVYATGLRNCSGMTIQPATGALWCVVNERDGLGDNLPPDYATHVADGAFYGWPWYYIGANQDPRHKGERPDLAKDVTVPDVLFQAHSAPLGITFYDGKAFPAEYRGDAFVAMHGSWNRDHRTGYKVVRLLFDDSGKPTGVYEDFMVGFVADDQRVWGRPVDVTVAKDGSLLVSDDASGTIWRVTSAKSASE